MTQTTTQGTGVAPGWYPDGRGSIRYFDGNAWTQHVQPPAPAAPAAAAPAAQYAPAQYAAPAAAATAAAVPAAAAAVPAAAAQPQPAEDEDEPFYRTGWFIVDAVVLAAMALVVVLAVVFG